MEVEAEAVTSTFDPNLWFYVNQVKERVAFRKPQVTARNVTAIVIDSKRLLGETTSDWVPASPRIGTRTESPLEVTSTIDYVALGDSFSAGPFIGTMRTDQSEIRLTVVEQQGRRLGCERARDLEAPLVPVWKRAREIVRVGAFRETTRADESGIFRRAVSIAPGMSAQAPRARPLAITTSIVNSVGEMTPSSRPMLRTMSSMSPLVFIRAPSDKLSFHDCPTIRAAKAVPPNFPATAVRTITPQMIQRCVSFNRPISVRSPV